MSDKNNIWYFNDSSGAILKKLIESEYNAVNFIQDLPPRQQNLFWACMPGEAVYDNSGETPSPISDIPFRIQEISFTSPTLEFDDLKTMHVDIVKSLTLNKAVTITWLEDAYRSVQTFHMNWFSKWYNRETDSFVSGISGKYKVLVIYGFHYINAAEMPDPESASLQVPLPEAIFKITIGGLRPLSFGDWKFSFNDTGNEDTLSLSYRAERAIIQYSKTYETDEKLWQSLNPSEIGLISNIKKVGGILI
jgi:hypothetical protein